MLSPHPMRWIVLLMFGALTAFGCVGTDTGEAGESGSLSLDLVIGDGIVINEVQWRITGNGMDMSGSIDVSAPGSTASVEVFGLPVGEEDYTVELTALSDDEEVSCKGSANFNVVVGESTDVMVMLNCKLPETLGGVRVNGKFNFCAQLTKATAAPLQTSVGNDIAVTSQAEDADGDPIAYNWTATGGSIADPSAASTTYTCQEAGDHTITISVTDNDEYCNMATWTFPVTCVPGEAECQTNADCESGEVCEAGQCVADVECMIDSDCSDGEICVDNACVPDVECQSDMECDDENQCTVDICGDGQCSNPNQQADFECDQDGGSVCDGNGACVECNTDAQCDMGEVCTNNACVPDVECMMDSDCDDSNDCTDDVCTAGACSNPSSAADTACTSGGGLVCDGNGACVECNSDAQCAMGEVCTDNACVPDVECMVDADCEDGNDCTADSCAAGMCSNPNEPADTACTGGGGSVCDGQGNCVECNDAAQCPGGGECQAPACESNGCALNDAPNGTLCNDDTGTCMAGVCEPTAQVVYEQSFESLDPADAGALANDGWLYFGNVFAEDESFKFGFGPFAAPTTSGQISGIVTGEGGPDQGANQLVVFSNYDCCQDAGPEGHFNGTDLVETIVFQEINPIPAAFIGEIFEFSFDAKRGNIDGATTAQAFIRTIDPGAGFATTNNVPLDTTNLSTDWARYTITLDLSDPALEGQILQFGFSTIASNFESAGNFYDNNVAVRLPTP